MGIDIINTDRIASLLHRRGTKILPRLLNPLNHHHQQKEMRAESVAGRWALREAAYKAAFPLCKFSDICIDAVNNVPVVVDKNGGIRFHGSMTHDGGVSAAVVLAYTDC